MRPYLAAVALLALTVPAAPARAVEPGTVTISQGVDVSTLDPLKASVTTDTNVQAQLYDTLARRSPDGASLVPQLATSWKRIAPTVWEFKLRRGVTLANGDPCTSADAVHDDAPWLFCSGTRISTPHRSGCIGALDRLAGDETLLGTGKGQCHVIDHHRLQHEEHNRNSSQVRDG